MIRRCIMDNVVTGGIISAMCLLGCGGAQEEPQFVDHEHESAQPTMTESNTSVEVPSVVVQAMTRCIEATNVSSSASHQTFQYGLGANDQGKVLEVKLRDSTLRAPSLEACFEQALTAMDVPKEALQLRSRHASSKPFSGGENMSRSRGDVGVIQAVAAPVALAPIVLTAAGVVILVAVVVHVIDDVTAERERCKKVLEFCIAKCTEEAIPSGTPNGDPFFKCRKDCLDAANCWGVKLF